MADSSKTLTARIVTAIANEKGVRDVEFPPLFGSIDPDALERMFADSASAEHITVQFTHSDYRVTIDGGCVSVTKADALRGTET